MKYTIVKMKNGIIWEAPIFTYRPKEGYIELMGVDERIHLRDVESAVTPDQWIHSKKIGDRDELERARNDGWSGQ